ncbi:SufE family protein [Psychromonas sp. MME2]|uniref:SufE family protein n=1 Tax=Psychromonas sp. MME2 TaxID=3231033 RepID=UPI00339D25C4
MSSSLMSIEQLIDAFAENRGWDKQYRLIIQLGKQLPALHEDEKNDENQVKGCESLAWLVVEQQGEGYHFKMASDTRVVSGLMMILFILFEGKNAQQIKALDSDAVFQKLGLLHHLSPSQPMVSLLLLIK